jgi:hypothetical protein
VDEAEIQEMAELDRKRSLAGKNIRVYSGDGFVSKSYKYWAPIDYVERGYDDGKKYFRIGQTDAKRSMGNGSLTTINGRGV